MLVRRVSPAVVAYLAIAIAQMVVVLIVAKAGVSIAAVVFSCGLFYFLFMGQPWAWWVLLALNSVGLVALVVSTGRDIGTHVLWSHVILLLVTTLAMEAALISPAMRMHVATRGLRLRMPRPPVDAVRRAVAAPVPVEELLPVTDPKPIPATQPAAKAKPATRPKPKPKPKPAPKAKPNPAPKAQPRSAPRPKPKPTTKTQPTSAPRPDPADERTERTATDRERAEQERAARRASGQAQPKPKPKSKGSRPAAASKNRKRKRR